MGSKSLYLASIFAIALTACAADDSTSGVARGTVTGTDVNPAGVPYPSANQGYSTGFVAPNLKFIGWPDGDFTKEPVPVSLANFYDPEGTTYKLIHIQAAAGWCGPCQAEARAAGPLTDELAAKGVVWLTAIVDGTKQSAGATSDDLKSWMKKFSLKNPGVVDSDQQKLGPFFPGAAVPWNGTIDARTMKVLESQLGGNNYDSADAIRKSVDKWLAKTATP
jgi:thiol-disulfide isomerase/thioredoxin